MGRAPAIPSSTRSRNQTRREFLVGLHYLWTGALLFSPLAQRHQASVDPAIGHEVLSDADLRIARLAEIFARREPAAADALASWAEAQLPRGTGDLAPIRQAEIARRQLLDPIRLADELAAEDVVTIDGWLLARSEAALAARLLALQRGSTPAGSLLS